MSIVFPTPTPVQTSQFIFENNVIEHCNLSMAQIQETISKTHIHPYAAGHLSALNYAINKLAKDSKWPASHPVQYEHELKSHINLLWLRTLHEKLMTPVAIYADMLPTMYKQPIEECGVYRTEKHYIGPKLMPRPDSLKRLLHQWFTSLAKYHASISSQLNNPSLQLVGELSDKAYHFHIQLQCIHPFSDGTGRVARIVENTLRFRWGLPMRIIKHENIMSYIKDIGTYEDAAEWQLILKNARAV